MLAAFVIVEMILLGRLFQASLLRTGQPPKLGGIHRNDVREEYG